MKLTIILYRNILSEINKKDLKIKLDTFMKNNGYTFCKPEPSVGYFL